MPKYLHILNGDSTLEAFKNQPIEGEAIVWREVLCEGPTITEVGSDFFWEIRTAFFESFFEVSEEEFRQNVIQEFNTFKNAVKYFNEIVLWFEYDLFCQINVMGILSWFQSNKPRGVAISLVCVGQVPGYSKFVGLGEIDPNLYPSLFQERTILNQKDLIFAQSIWKVYNSRNHKELKALAQATPIAFNYLDDALFAHFQRFPMVENGVNEIEHFLLTTIQENESITSQEVLKKALQRHNFYGYGDLQYQIYLQNLAPMINWGETLSLNKLGQKVLQGKANFLLHANHIYRYGGALNTNFRWIPQSESLVKVEKL